MIHTVYIDQVLELARKATAGADLPSVSLKLRTDQTLAFAFMTDGTVAAVSGWVSGKCVIKERPTTGVLLLDSALDVTGETTGTRYKAAWTAETLDGPTDGVLRKYMGDATLPKEAWCEVEWIDGGGTHSVSFPIMLQPTFNDPEDEAPDPAISASWAWIKSIINVSGSSIFKAVDDALKTITLSVSMAWGDITGKPTTFEPSAHTHAIADTTGLQGALDAKLAASTRGANDGVAPLDSGGKVPSANLPSYVDDVIEAANYAALPGTGESGKIYVALDTGKTYRWSGSAYVEISSTPAMASQVEAEAGSDNTKLMTPLRTAQAIAALASGGGGAALPTGSRLTGYWLAAPEGYVLANGDTIGNASSGATRANSDTEALFLLLWTVLYATGVGASLQNSDGDVVGSNGTAAADYAANYRLTLPDERLRVPVMAYADYTLATVTAIIGARGGEENHTLSEAEIPEHSHAVNDPGHVHGYLGNPGASSVSTSSSDVDAAQTPGTIATDNATTGLTIETTGGTEGHNNVQPFICVNVAIKL